MVPLDGNKVDTLILAVAVINEKFFPVSNIGICVNANARVTVDHLHLGVTVGMLRMVGKTNFIAMKGSIDALICKSTISMVTSNAHQKLTIVELEQVASLLLVVHEITS